MVHLQAIASHLPDTPMMVYGTSSWAHFNVKLHFFSWRFFLSWLLVGFFLSQIYEKQQINLKQPNTLSNTSIWFMIQEGVLTSTTSCFIYRSAALHLSSQSVSERGSTASLFILGTSETQHCVFYRCFNFVIATWKILKTFQLTLHFHWTFVWQYKIFQIHL